ncbi:PilZ domain-containing protein [Luteimonas sp. RD2P54]|uniref:PilZ domain-containing protein n=1 Tax=Luteimonas endophytica TaxID=3042023 RepID=A0ABT6J975_9GAMM|nr:PilZ domain-containing protein [Luteimonas endophytica]MDH5822758.1 PilZ domain-containing protein [Luteimonas endophytica]
MNATGVSADQAERDLFEDALSCELHLPAQLVPGAGPGRLPQAEALLAGLAQVEDLRMDDAGEERGELPQLAQRMDAKLDLMLMLLGRLVSRSSDALPLRAVRWSHRGVRLDAPARPEIAAGAAGVLHLQPSEWLPDHLELPATVLAEAPADGGFQRLWLRFGALPAGLADALEKHLFRLHRKQIAASRR